MTGTDFLLSIVSFEKYENYYAFDILSFIVFVLVKQNKHRVFHCIF